MDTKKHAKKKPAIPRPEVTVAQVVLLALSQKGRLGFSELVAHPQTKQLGHQRTQNSFYTALSRLMKKKRVVRTSDRKYELTDAGQYAALKAFVRRELVVGEREPAKEKKPWDGKWRVVFFDVPEAKRPVRDYLRSVLKRMDFHEFQRSMWIHPAPVPKFLVALMEDPKMRQYARIITTTSIDYDEDLRRRFKLTA